MNLKPLYARYKFWISSPIFGVVLALIMFFLAKLPFWISVLCLLATLILPLIYIVTNEYIRKVNKRRNVLGSERDMETVIRIENAEGDATIHSRIRITNTDKNQIQFLYKDVYTTPGPEINLDEPKLVASSLKDMVIKERAKIQYSKSIIINDIERIHNYVECDYFLTPPLRGEGDFVEYDLDVSAKEYSKDAFSKNGGVEGFIVRAVANYIEMKIVTIQDHQLEVLDCWIENSQAKRFDLAEFKTDPPVISKTGHELSWRLDFPRENHLYLFKYRTVIR